MTAVDSTRWGDSLGHLPFRADGEALDVTIDRPNARNSLNPLAHRDLKRDFDPFDADGGIRVAVIRGLGERTFCSGSDLEGRTNTAEEEYPPGGLAGLTHRLDSVKLVIAAVNGHALGGGLKTVLACDLAISVNHAKFGFPEPCTGLTALSGGIHRLVRQITCKSAMGLLQAGQSIDARTALRLGLFNELVPTSDSDATVDSWVSRNLRFAPLALRASKQVARRRNPRARSGCRDYASQPRRAGGSPYLSGKAVASLERPVTAMEFCA